VDSPQAILFKVMHAAYSDLAATGFKTSREDGRWCQDARFGGFLKWKWTKTMGFNTKKPEFGMIWGYQLFFFGNLYFWCLKYRFVFLAMLHARSFSCIGIPGAFPSPLGGSLISHEDERRWSAFNLDNTHEQTWNPTTRQFLCFRYLDSETILCHLQLRPAPGRNTVATPKKNDAKKCDTRIL